MASRNTEQNRGARKSIGAAILVVLFLVVGAGPAAATWSIVGVDPETGEVGVAVASCVPAYVLGDLDAPVDFLTLAPGQGAGISQALLNDDVPPVMRRLLIEGSATDEIITEVSAESFDSDFALRQHGVVTIDGAASGYSGAETDAVSVDRQGRNVSAQGNILVSEAVIDDAVAAFQDPANSDLTARLVAALQAGADAGGDSRCGAQTALFAQVVVARVGDDPSQPSVMLLTTVDEGTGENPVGLLTAAYERGETRTSLLNATDSGPIGIILLVGAALVLIVVGVTVLLWKAIRRSRRAS